MGLPSLHTRTDIQSFRHVRQFSSASVIPSRIIKCTAAVVSKAMALQSTEICEGLQSVKHRTHCSLAQSCMCTCCFLDPLSSVQFNCPYLHQSWHFSVHNSAQSCGIWCSLDNNLLYMYTNPVKENQFWAHCIELFGMEFRVMKTQLVDCIQDDSRCKKAERENQTRQEFWFSGKNLLAPCLWWRLRQEWGLL